jgi:uracil-DNA glycosylase
VNAGSHPLCGTDWNRLLAREFTQPDWVALLGFLESERSRTSVYPPGHQVFRALELTWCKRTRVVIVGQDPYDAPGRADGLCFSVPCGVAPPGSLENIHKELQRDCGISPPAHGSLAPWANRGVLLLNTSLTVCEGQRRLHRQRWRRFTDAVIRVVTQESDPIFLLWGGDAQDKERLITGLAGTSERIIKSSHPSPLSANRTCRGNPPFNGSSPFSKTNQLLRDLSRRPINWTLSP